MLRSALTLVPVLNFNVHGAGNRIISNINDPGLNSNEILAETFWGFDVGAWETLKYASNVITATDVLIITGDKTKSNQIAGNIYHYYAGAKFHLDSDFFAQIRLAKSRSSAAAR